jgi:hypothetical protein
VLLNNATELTPIFELKKKKKKPTAASPHAALLAPTHPTEQYTFDFASH